MTRRPYSGLSKRDREGDAAQMAAYYGGGLDETEQTPAPSQGVPIADPDSDAETQQQAGPVAAVAIDNPGGGAGASPLEQIGAWLVAGTKIRRLEIEAFKGKVEIELFDTSSTGERWFSGFTTLPEALKLATDAIGTGEI
jgi:hypothetical protein